MNQIPLDSRKKEAFFCDFSPAVKSTQNIGKVDFTKIYLLQNGRIGPEHSI